MSSPNPQAANDNHPTPTTPLRLATALQYAFPHGGITLAGLRREALRGRLKIERIAGKDFTTLAAIEEMRQLCHVKVEAPTYMLGQNAVRQMAESRNTPTGSSETGETSPARAAFLATLQARKKA